MKKIIIIGLLLLIMIVQVSCVSNISSTESTSIQTTNTESTPIPTSDNLDEVYISEVMKAAKGESVVKSYVEDFAMNGNREGFVLTKKTVGEMESKFSLWFVSNDKLEAIKKDVLAVNNSTIELIRNKESIHVLFREVQFTLNNDFIATIYGVYNGKPKVLFEKDNLMLDVEDDKICGTEVQYCYYDSITKGHRNSADVTYEFYWSEQEEKYREYGADIISKSEFLQYSGGKEIWNKLESEMSGENQKIEYTFLKRTNDTIDINMKISSKKGWSKHYVTLLTNGRKIVTKKMDVKDGNKKRCKYPEIAKFE